MSGNETPTAIFEHPRIRSNDDIIDTMIRDVFGQEAVAAAIAPNFSVEPPSASRTLQLAYDIEPQFATAQSACGAKSHSGDRYLVATPHASGYAVKVIDTMPLSTPERLQHTLGAWNQELGTSMYAVRDMPESLAKADDAGWLALNNAARDRMPHMISPSHRITLERSPTELGFGRDEYVIVVTANDVAAVRRLWQYLAARAAAGEPVTIGSLVQSPEYVLMKERSQCARDTLARKYAQALGVEIDDKPLLTSMHYTITPANSLAHGHHAARTPYEVATEPTFYVAYSNASPAHLADGGLLVSHGIMGGHTLLRTEDGSPWQNPKYLSLVPATSAEVHAEKTSVPALAREQSTQTQAAFDARVAWRGDLAGTVIHSAANESFDSMQDPYSLEWADKLSARHKGPLRQRQYRFVAGQLPSDSTLYLTREELYEVSIMPETPQNILVAIDNDVVSDITRNWDSVVRHSGYKGELHDVFANSFEREDDENDGFRILSRHTTCTDPSHAHSREPQLAYVGAAKYGIVLATGTYSRSHMSADEYNDRERTANYGTSPFAADFQSRTVLNLDKNLVAIVTRPQQTADL